MTGKGKRRTSPRPSPQRGEGVERASVSSPVTPHSLLSVTPDFVFRKRRTVIFVDGCFWHGCPQHATWPAHRAAWWRRKIEGNQARDRLVTRTLRKSGWHVVRVWEHELARKREERLVARLRRAFGV
ncbi:MAG: very short patch repair endonuclease [Verrucomicrobia bacterium]|nr:very short patch repair endonuclease [Verrucomicrobiota bacterium]